MFSIELSFLINPIKIPIKINKYVVFPVVKKLPVLLIGNISTKNKKINGIINLFWFNIDLAKYFLIKVKYIINEKIIKTIEKPTIQVSVKISK